SGSSTGFKRTFVAGVGVGSDVGVADGDARPGKSRPPVPSPSGVAISDAGDAAGAVPSANGSLPSTMNSPPTPDPARSRTCCAGPVLTSPSGAPHTDPATTGGGVL